MSQNAFDAAMARHLQELLFHERPGKRTGSEYEERGTAGEWGGVVREPGVSKLRPTKPFCQ